MESGRISAADSERRNELEEGGVACSVIVCDIDPKVPGVKDGKDSGGDSASDGEKDKKELELKQDDGKLTEDALTAASSSSALPAESAGLITARDDGHVSDDEGEGADGKKKDKKKKVKKKKDSGKSSGSENDDNKHKKAKTEDKDGENSSLKTEGESGGFGTTDDGRGSYISSSLHSSGLPSDTLSRVESSSATRRPLTPIESLMGHPQRNTTETNRVTISRYTSHFTS
ncbi:lisH domain-containing -like protein [Labeo rohita]|uniref:LisH domain-containing-like protein n=1 Tax=Labeo rohita TaxID=84645 RepID=A0A498M8Z1_LABRO|nr:lisH domain-containing -like protein [Labeo rohita]